MARCGFKRKIRLLGSFIGDGAKFEEWPVFPHGCVGVFISNGVTLGKKCVIFQQVTIGSNTLKDSKNFGAPSIGDNCYIGAGAKIIGAVKIGDNCRIGANAVVVKDVPANSVVVPGECRVIQKENLDNTFVAYKPGLFEQE